VVYRQLNYIRNKDVGFYKEHIVYLPLNQGLISKRDSFQEELRKQPGILNVSLASSLPSNVNNVASGIDWEGNNGRKLTVWFVSVDFDYFETMGLKMIEGRGFARDFPSDIKEGYIINEEAAKELELDSPVGKWFSLWGKKGAIIGVVKDYNFQSLHNQIEPLLFWMGREFPDIYMCALLRIPPENIQGTIKSIESVWNTFTPNYPFEYYFLDETFAFQYREEKQMGKIFGYFTSLAIFISCLGLFALASYTAELKTKEIGIRKVFGATASSIIFLMSNSYTKWILLANVIAWPSAYFFTNSWLHGFAYRTSISLAMFLLAALGSFIIALLSVSYQSIKSSIADPVDSLKYE